MKPGVPWSIKGIEPELREAAKTAARRSGMTLGAWLNTAINEQAETEVVMPDISPRGRGATRQRAESNEHPIERAASKLEDIAEKLSRIQPLESEASFRGNAQLDSNVTFAKILGRVETHEKQTTEAFNVVNERLGTISKQITRHQPVKFEETPSYQALEKAVRNIIEHLDVSDKRTRDNMKTLQDRITEMSQRLGGSGDKMLRDAPALGQLEQRLTDLARKIDQPVQTPVDQLRVEIEQLAQRIDSVRDSSEQLATRAQTQAVQAAQGELRAIESRLINLLNDAKQSIMANHVGPAELQRFKGEIDKLHARIDEAQRGTASERDVSALKVAVEQLTSRLSQTNDQKPIAELDRRVVEIAQKLERAEQQGLGSTMTSEVERRFAELDQRLSQNREPVENPKLREMDDRLARTEQQLTHLETIERAIAQLYEAFEDNRKNPPTPAVGEASAAAKPVTLAGSPEIVALETGLQAVRDAAASADTRNQETLEAVHETLEQIVTKLAELETAAIGQRVGLALAPKAPIENIFVAEELKASAPAPAVAPVPELKIEAAAPAVEPVLSAVLVESAEEKAEETPVASAETGISDLIAAARKLHQQNNAQPSGQLSSFAPGKGKAKGKDKSAKGFSLPFLTAKDGKASKALAGKSANSNEQGSKRRLVFLGILLLAVATFATTNMLSRHPAPPTTPTSIEQPATPPAAAPAPAPQSSSQSGPIPLPNATAPNQAGKIPPLPDPAPAPLANPGQSSDASDSLQQTDQITTGAISPAAKTDGPKAAVSPVSALDPAVGPVKLREAAANGDNSAQFIVATHYLNGDTTAQNYDKAAYWYGKAASAGLAPAQYRLATMYERGTGVEKNLTTALKWYEAAGTMGNIKAMHNAAVIAAGADAGGPDYPRAYKWFSLAAGYGLKDSEFNLAVLMERGLGAKQDTVEALFWYTAAAAQGDADAKTRVAELGKTMSPAQVDAVTKRFKAWVPQKAPEAANVVAINDSRWNPDKTAASAPANTQSLNDNPNDKAKHLLTQLGYRVGSLDGTLDAKTSNAIKLFQIKEGMKATGKLTPDLLDTMQSRVG